MAVNLSSMRSSAAMSRLSCIRFASLAREALLLSGETNRAQHAVQYGRQRLLLSGPSSLQSPLQLAQSHTNAAVISALQVGKWDASVPPLSNFSNIDRSLVKRGSCPQQMHHRSIALSQASASAVSGSEDKRPEDKRPSGDLDSSNDDPGNNKPQAADGTTSSATIAGGSETPSPETSRKAPGKSFGQNFNLVGIRITIGLLLGGKKHLGVPHVAVPDIRWIDWGALKAAGFLGVVFDKDNTLTVPYALHIHEPLEESLQECGEVFEGKMVLLSNSAGLKQFDPDGTEAGLLERKLGIPVLRHGAKKPAGTADALTAHFGCAADRLVMVGDRYFTDVVFGNRHGMLTIRPSPLTATGEPTMVKKVRLLEATLLSRWRGKGISAPEHSLAPAPGKFIKDPGCW